MGFHVLLLCFRLRQSVRLCSRLRALRTTRLFGAQSAAFLSAFTFAAVAGTGAFAAALADNGDAEDLKKRFAKKRDILGDVMALARNEQFLSRANPAAVDDWALCSHYLGKSYPLTASKSELAKVSDFQLKDRMRYAMKHAAAIYPSGHLVAMGLLPPSSLLEMAASNMDLSVAVVLQRVFPHLKCASADDYSSHLRLDRTVPRVLDPLSILAPDSSDLDDDGIADGLPAYYVCVDDKEKAVVVSVRGTASVEDIVTDLNCSPKHIEDPLSGQRAAVHKGLWRSARHIAREAHDVVQSELALHSDYRLLVTGHSLGAGTAALLAFIWGRPSQTGASAICEKPWERMECFAFASPCVISKNLADSCQGFIHSVAFGSDCVTRLGVCSTLQLLDRCDILAETAPSVLSGAREALAQGLGARDCPVAAQLLLERLDKVCARQSPDTPLLFPIGTVLWYVPSVVCDASKSVDEKRRALCGGEHLMKRTPFIHTKLTESFENALATNPLFAQFAADRKKAAQQMSYVLCDATALRPLFSELLFDSADSLLTHLPSQYTQAMAIDSLEEVYIEGSEPL